MSDDKDLRIMFDNIGKIQYQIPVYQRGYDWDSKQVNDFWDDLYLTNEIDSDPHFYGDVYTTKKQDSDSVIFIVDGQQRLTTCALLLICARDIFHTIDSSKNDEYFKGMQQRLYTADDGIHIDKKKPILTLSKTNKKFFQTYLMKEKNIHKLPDPTPYISNVSNKKLLTAYEIILEKLKNIQKKSGFTGVNAYVYTMLDKFYIHQHTLGNFEKIHRIFNLMNNRGKELSYPDLVKNYIFGILSDQNKSEEELNTLDDTWNDMRERIENDDDASSKQDDFFHYYMLSVGRYNFAKGDNVLKITPRNTYKMFEKLSKNVPPEEIIIDLDKWTTYFTSIRLATDTFGKENDIQHYLQKIMEIDARFLYPVLLVGYSIYWLENDKKSFRKLVKMCFIYHIRVKSVGTAIGLEQYGNKMKKIIDDIKINKKPMDDIINDLIDDETYDDEKFKINFKNFVVSNSKLAIALLEESEFMYDEKFRSSDISLEHIMPKSLKSWKKNLDHDYNNYSDQKLSDLHSKFKNRLGNLTLLTKEDNIHVASKSFSEKCTTYQNSPYKITQKITKFKKWTHVEINEREEILLDLIIKRLNLRLLLQ